MERKQGWESISSCFQIMEQLKEYQQAVRMPALQCFILDLEKRMIKLITFVNTFCFNLILIFMF